MQNWRPAQLRLAFPGPDRPSPQVTPRNCSARCSPPGSLPRDAPHQAPPGAAAWQSRSPPPLAPPLHRPTNAVAAVRLAAGRERRGTANPGDALLLFAYARRKSRDCCYIRSDRLTSSLFANLRTLAPATGEGNCPITGFIISAQTVEIAGQPDAINLETDVQTHCYAAESRRNCHGAELWRGAQLIGWVGPTARLPGMAQGALGCMRLKIVG